MKWVEGWRRGAAGTVSGTGPGTPTGAHAPTIPSDDSLLALIGAGDSGALATVFDRHGGAVYALAVVLAGSPQGAEMVVQDVFVRLWHVASGCGGGQVPLRPWLAAATLRRAGRVPPHRRPQPDPDPDGQFAGPEAGPEGGAALGAAAVIALTGGDLRTDDLAAWLGIDRPTVLRLVGNGLHALAVPAGAPADGAGAAITPDGATAPTGSAPEGAPQRRSSGLRRRASH